MLGAIALERACYDTHYFQMVKKSLVYSGWLQNRNSTRIHVAGRSGQIAKELR